MRRVGHTEPVIAILDDEPRMRSALCRLLATHGYRVENYACAAELLAALPTHPADCLVLDLHMPEVSGFDVLAALDPPHGTMPVVVISGQDEPGTAERVQSLGASAFLTKPVDETALVAAIKSAIASGAHPAPLP